MTDEPAAFLPNVFKIYRLEPMDHVARYQVLGILEQPRRIGHRVTFNQLAWLAGQDAKALIRVDLVVVKIFYRMNGLGIMVDQNWERDKLRKLMGRLECA